MLERAGSSPGPLASFFLENTFILGFIFMSILLAYFFFGMNTIISKADKKHENSPLIFLLYYFSYYFLLSGPLNILLVFDPSLICFLLFIMYVGKYSINKFKKCFKKSRNKFYNFELLALEKLSNPILIISINTNYLPLKN